MEERIEMPRRRNSFNVVRALLVVASQLCFSTKADARPPSISVGEVTVKSIGADSGTEQRLRFLLGREIDRLRLDSSRRSDALIISVSLVRLEARESRDGTRANCVVSA